jgi:signal transduction histidine kinase
MGDPDAFPDWQRRETGSQPNLDERTLEGLIQLGSLLTSMLSPREVAAQVAEYGCLISGLDAFLVYLTAKEGGKLEAAGVEGLNGDLSAAHLRLLDIALLDLERTTPAVVPLDALGSPALAALCSAEGYQRAWVAPLVVEGVKQAGLMIGLDERSTPPERHQLGLFRLLALQAAGALSNSLRYEAEQRAQRELLEAERRASAEKAAEDERSHLARDLHDSVTQALFAASLKAEALTVAGMVSGNASAVVEELARLNRGALAQMRTLLLELRGQSIEDVPIRQLLQTVADATEGRSRVKVSVTIEGDEALPDALHTAVYRITQEALNNVAKHARADNAWVSLSVTDSLVELVVGDDGSGYEPATPLDPSHMGLASMAARAREAEAVLLTSTAPGRGTILSLTWRPPGTPD